MAKLQRVYKEVKPGHWMWVTEVEEASAGGSQPGTVLPVADPTGVTVDSTTYDNPVSGEGKLTTLVSPPDAAVLALAREGDPFPFLLLNSVGGDLLYFGDGSFDVYSGSDGAFIGLSSGQLRLYAPDGLDASSKKIHNLADGVDQQDAATVAQLGGGGGSTPDVQEFTTTGSYVWTKPAGATVVQVVCVGSGGGGGGGQDGVLSSLVWNNKLKVVAKQVGVTYDFVMSNSSLGDNDSYSGGSSGQGGATRSFRLYRHKEAGEATETIQEVIDRFYAGKNFDDSNADMTLLDDFFNLSVADGADPGDLITGPDDGAWTNLSGVALTGGGGGGGGVVSTAFFPASALGATEDVGILAPGAGGAAGVDGTHGDDVGFGLHLTGPGGRGGHSGDSGGLGGGGYGWSESGSLSTAADRGDGANGGVAGGGGDAQPTAYNAAGGGGGGGVSAANQAFNGGYGGAPNHNLTGGAGNHGVAGSPGGDAPENHLPYAAGGGGGGGGGSADVGSDGGKGAVGSGGGGGGAGTTGGTGGDGGEGYVLVISW